MLRGKGKDKSDRRVFRKDANGRIFELKGVNNDAPDELKGVNNDAPDELY